MYSYGIPIFFSCQVRVKKICADGSAKRNVLPKEVLVNRTNV